MHLVHRSYSVSVFISIIGDAVWDGQNKTLFKIPDLSNYQPWRQVVRGKRICTTDMCIAQDVQLENHSAPVDCKDIATALHKWNLLHQTESIQISPNGRFCSVKFQTTQIMQAYCTEGLTISEGNNIYFKPDYTPRQSRSHTFISFLNVPLDTKEKQMEA